MRHFRFPLIKSFEFVQQRRKFIQPNDGFPPPPPPYLHLPPSFLSSSFPLSHAACALPGLPLVPSLSSTVHLLFSSSRSPPLSFMKQLVSLEERLFSSTSMAVGDWSVGPQTSKGATSQGKGRRASPQDVEGALLAVLTAATLEFDNPLRSRLDWIRFEWLVAIITSSKVEFTLLREGVKEACGGHFDRNQVNRLLAWVADAIEGHSLALPDYVKVDKKVINQAKTIARTWYFRQIGR